MNILMDFVRNLIVFRIIVFIILELSPGNEYQKYIKIFAFLSIIIMLLSPLLDIFDGRMDFKNVLDRYMIKNEFADMEKSLMEYDEKKILAVTDEYKKGIEENVKDIVEDEQAVFDKIMLELELDAGSSDFLSIKHMDVYISKKYSETDRIREIIIEDKSRAESITEINIKNRISQFYNLQINNINIIK